MGFGGEDPLSRFPVLHTRDVDEFRQRLTGLFSVRSIDLGRGGQRHFEGHVNSRPGQDVSLTYARYGSSVGASLSNTEFFLQGFPLRGNGSLTVGRSEAVISRDRGVVSGPGADMAIKYSSDFEHLILTIKPNALTRKLSGLIGRPVDASFRILTSTSPRPEMAGAQQRLVEFAAREMGHDMTLPPLVLAELEQALIVAYLCNNGHSYSHLLEGKPAASASWQVRRVEEYIEHNWDQPVTIEALALVANASVRSLFYSFKNSRGLSPMAFVKQVRLRHAREMLTSPDPAINVTAVALTCGFTNLGHFAKYYQGAFGERPSDTLRMALRTGEAN